MNDDGPRHEDEGRTDPHRQVRADAATVEQTADTSPRAFTPNPRNQETERRTFTARDATAYGSRLVKAATTAAKRASIGAVPTLLLIRMALRAKDSDSEPWSRLEAAERAEAILHDDDEAGRRAVERAVAVLVKAKLVSRTSGGNRYGAARYRLHLAVDKSSRPPAEHGVKDSYTPRSAVLDPALSGSRPRAQRGAKEDIGEHEEEVARARDAATCSKHPNGDTGERCGGCMAAREENARRAAIAAERAEHERRARVAALNDPIAQAEAVEAARQRLGGHYPPDAIIAAAREAMPDSLAAGLRVLTEDDMARWTP